MGRRAERLGEAIREEVAQLVSYELKDPRLGLATVTRVEMSADLGHARVWVGVSGDEAERRKSLAALRSAAGFVRRELGRRLGIRQVPEVDFHYDKGLDATERVERLLAEERQAAEAARVEVAGDGGEAPAQPAESNHGREPS